MATNTASTETAPSLNAKARYQSLMTSRQTALERARKNSELTIPGLIPTDGQDANASFSQPWQSLGARGVNNLASWLLLTQFPPDAPFFRLGVHEDTANELGERLTAVKEGLARISNKAQLLCESSAARPVFMELLRYLIVAGNALVYQPIEGTTPRLFRIDQYVVMRDEVGRMLEAVVAEKVYPLALSEEVRTATGVELKEDSKDTVDLYTHVRKIGDELYHYQEINGRLVPGSEGNSPYDSRGWLALRWQAIPGSDWGRAMVSEYAGDLISLEDLNKAMVTFAAAAARVIHVVDPASMIDVDELVKAESGDYLIGHRDKIGTLQLEKSQDFQVANLVAERLEQRLSNAFMLRSGMTRDAERVTAEEIRAIAQELENVLGGTYTVLSAEFQLPYVKRLLYILQKNQEAPELPEDVQPIVTTGFDAMGRSQTASKLRSFLADLTQTLGPAIVEKIIDPNEVSMRLGESYGIEALQQLIKSPEVQAQEAQATQAAGLMQAAAPQIAKGATEAINQQTEVSN